MDGDAQDRDKLPWKWTEMDSCESCSALVAGKGEEGKVKK